MINNYYNIIDTDVLFIYMQLTFIVGHLNYKIFHKFMTPLKQLRQSITLLDNSWLECKLSNFRTSESSERIKWHFTLHL